MISFIINTAAQALKGTQRHDLQIKLDEHKASAPDTKLILSIDRLDYSKGIAKRLNAFEYFLNKYPEYKDKVRLYPVVSGPTYLNINYLKKRLMNWWVELTELSTVNPTPIWYFTALYL